MLAKTDGSGKLKQKIVFKGVFSKPCLSFLNPIRDFEASFKIPYGV